MQDTGTGTLVCLLPACANPPEDLALMRRIDELHMEMPYAGGRMLSRLLKREGQPVGRKRVSTLMQRMDIHALYRKPNTSKRHPAHKVYPYLLRHLEIARPNHVWAADITYIPMKRGFVYLFAVMDWASRRVLAWRISNTLTTDFCIEAVQEAFNRYGRPEILQHRSGLPVQPRFHGTAESQRHPDQHGRQRLLAG